ncbi:winged helix-turn-helix transcriptional regulator [Nonomuraea africana]|uniref:DNA-binding HxlR family transcriptional regulator n=1 Tax=Nonomuraea africana TaxID=46171 RepID=A0ABR9KIB3_9ACTN|nr:winged helix-turn-helix transcriptional regulator [Nonomuraea africana]MBE1561773.1 DNA-binding HxlR family transcriptional regulator [Nonomuraea africana]
MRSYQDPCGVARALDLVGERWALLVVRELMLGPKRFTDLHRDLPGSSQNVLSQRLRELEEAGVVRRRTLAPPVAVRVYELTEWGRGLEPVLLHLGRWGSQAPITTANQVGVTSLVLALRAMYVPGFEGSLELHVGEQVFRVTASVEVLEVTRGTAERPQAVLKGEPGALASVFFQGRELGAAIAAGELEVEGDPAAVSRLIDHLARSAA